uniref:DNA cytosine methyltransferase n=1 Tax=Pedobacter sp. TaxID=1411316 RepID=UPI00159A805C|nr:DNA cytosine methyltransferase [Pedobacter sp.]QJS06265.1 DdeI restriction endonuclease, DNA cytosine methyltransferase [Pedobacter sp.]
MSHTSEKELEEILVTYGNPRDYSNWKESDRLQNIDNNQVDYFLGQIRAEFKKVKLVDNSLDLNSHEKKVLSFFKNKLTKEINEYDKRTPKFEFIDLFCGAGGLSAGLEKAGLVPDLALDKDRPSLQTYHFNRPYLKDAQIINDDIKLVTKDFEFAHTPLVVGGPPCQGFSIANKQRQVNDERNQLYHFYLHTVELARPDIFLLENVEGILEHFGQIKFDFSKIGYSLIPYKLNTKDFGFPQNRKRVFILGIRDKYEKINSELKNIFESVIFAERSRYSFNLWDAIHDLPPLKAKTQRNSTNLEGAEWGYTFGDFSDSETPFSKLINKGFLGNIPILNHKAKYNNERDINIYGLLSPGERSDAASIAAINPYANRGDIFKDKFYKLLQNEVCKTITAHMYYDCHMYIHPLSARGLSPREAARVQGFADDYLFLGSPNEWYRQIGNAVSPILGNVLGKALRKVLERIYEY